MPQSTDFGFGRKPRGDGTNTVEYRQAQVPDQTFLEPKQPEWTCPSKFSRTQSVVQIVFVRQPARPGQGRTFILGRHDAI